MKKELLKFLCTSLFALVCMSVNATVYNGNCGDSEGDEPTSAVTWSFDTSTGTLTLTGTGAIKTFSDAGPMPYPWCDYDGSENHKGMEDITTIVIGEGITNIPDYAFAMYEYCTSVTLPSTLTIIGNSALEECAFTSITLPEGLEVINEYAFLGSKFSSLTLPSTLTTIGGSAFNDCESLTSITIPANVTSIGESAFQNCIALKAVEILRATPPTLGDLAFYDYNDDIIPTLTAIYVPAASVDTYKGAADWSSYATLIQKQNSTIIGGEHWTTFYDATTNYEVDENTAIMIIWGIEDGKIKTGYTNLSPESDNIIPAGQAVILRSTGIPVLTATPTESTNDAFNDNLLLGSEADKGDFENYNYYALANAGAGLGFYKVGNGTTIPVGKAYLKIDKAASSNFYSIDPDDNTTAIKNMKIGKDNNVYYDLSGRRVLYPKKGLYIMNGKKVIIK